MKSAQESNQETHLSSDSEISIGDDDFSFDLNSHSAVVAADNSIEQQNLVEEKLKITVMQEVHSYLLDIGNYGDLDGSKLDPLVQWRVNRFKYPCCTEVAICHSNIYSKRTCVFNLWSGRYR